MNKLSQQDKIWAFNYLTKYENEVKQYAGHFHLEDNAVVQFIEENDIYFEFLLPKSSKAGC